MVRVGFIGCGDWARAGHIAVMAQYTDVEIVGFADPQDQAIKSARELAPDLESVPGFADYREMLAEIAPEAVVIATPHTMHEQHILDAFAAGCHVMCEKPFVHSVAAARRVIARREEAELQLMVPYQRNLRSHYQFATAEIAAGNLGNLQMITAWQSQGWISRVRGSWRTDPTFSAGGQLMDSGSHLIDFVLHASQLKPVAVNAVLSNLGEQVNVNSALTIRFAGGALASLAVIGHAPSSMWEEIGFYGSNARILMRSTAQTPLKNGLEIDYESVGNEIRPVELPAGSIPDRNFIDTLQGNDHNRASAEAALRVLALSEAAWRSAESGSEAKVDL